MPLVTVRDLLDAEIVLEHAAKGQVSDFRVIGTNRSLSLMEVLHMSVLEFRSLLHEHGLEVEVVDVEREG